MEPHSDNLMSELKLQQCRLDGRYDIVSCLGHGSYAEIYIARDRAAKDEASAQVVIKALNLFLQGAPDAELERTLTENFQNEAIALDRVRHPQIINRLGHGTALDLAGRAFHYIVLEYMPGGDLAAYCRHRPLALANVINYLEQIAAGLSHAHSCGVIHRDIKPQNLLLSADCRTVKIADFGVAKLEASDGAITRVGTDVYSAPEHNPHVRTGPLDQFETAPLDEMRRPQQLTFAADVYSLAKTTYMLLTGESPRRFAQKQITALPESLTHHFWAAAVTDVLRTATDSHAERRYQTVERFLDEIKDAALAPTVWLERTAQTRQSAAPSSDQYITQTATTAAAAAVTPPMPPTLAASHISQTTFSPPPPVPDFPQTQELNQQHGALHERARIVVPLTREAKETVVAQPNHKAAPKNKTATAKRASRRALPHHSLARRVLLPFVLLFSLSGVLLATHVYVSQRVRGTTYGGTANDGSGGVGAAAQSDIGREAVAKTDINLRPDPSRSGKPIGLVEGNSRVRIIGVKGNWAQVEILQHGRDPRDAPPSVGTANRGWLDQGLLDKK